MPKNCSECKHVSYEWYQRNTCKNMKAIKELNFSFENVCNDGLECKDVYKAQEKDTLEDCKYFEMGFWAKVASFKYKICKKIFEFKLSRVK